LPPAVGQHVPVRPLWLQLTQAPWQETLQHTPSAQKFEAHSLFFVHTAPRGLGPQLPLTHLMPATQSASERQEVVHSLLVVSQLNGAHTVEGPGRQRPSPSHTLMSTTAALSQRPDLHVVPAGCLRQPPLPSHVPSAPQVVVAVAAQAPSCGSTPLGTNVQLPTEPGTSHALQVSLQAVAQHTPSTQWPPAQSAAHPHAAPFAFFPPSPALHAAPSPARSVPPSFGFPVPPPQPAITASSRTTASQRVTALTLTSRTAAKTEFS